MISNNLINFIKELSKNEDSIKVAAPAFDLYAKEYHIAQFTFSFTSDDIFFTLDGEIKEAVLYQNPFIIIPKHPSYEKNFSLEPDISCLLSLYHENGTLWSKEEENKLSTLLDLFYLHLSRYHLKHQLKKRALLDLSSGIPNTDGFIYFLTQVLKRDELSRYNGYYFNLKRFGLVNQRFGPQETGLIIARYANLLKDFITENEIVGRLGGDNFVALIRKERTSDFLHLLSGIETYGIQGNHRIPITISAVAGIVDIDESLTEPEEILNQSGTAFAIARNIKKVPYLFATPEIFGRTLYEKNIMETFPDAISAKEFKVFYQPKVETNGYTLIGAEALVRWKKDEQFLPPDSFIPILERSSSICALDFYVFEQVCVDISSWIRSGFTPVRVSVNFSRKHLSNPAFAENVLSIIDNYHVPSKYIEIEITETVNTDDQESLYTFIQKMHLRQISLAIDDFGTGYSSFNMLRKFTLDVLKIDKDFLENLPDQNFHLKADPVILESIIQMAKKLGISVITEGVETWEQVHLLREMGCTLVQGFLFDMPLPEPRFIQRLCQKQYNISKLKNF